MARRRARRARPLTSLLAALGCLASGTACGRPTKQQQQGAELYGRMCAVCHGPNGEGYKADQAPALRNPEFLASATDAFLRESIVNGRLGSTMSAWGRDSGGPLTTPEVDAVVAFMRLWQPMKLKSRALALDDRPIHGDSARGGLLYYQHQCVKCHGGRGVEGPNARIANPGFLANASNGFLRLAIRNGRAGTAMAPFGGKLGDQGIEDVIALVRSWAQRPVVRPTPPPDPPPIPLGKVPLNPKGPAPVGFRATPETPPADVIKAQLVKGAKMVLLDARAPSDYLKEHIEGAVSVPFYDPAPYFEKLPRDAWLVCYCACPHAESGQLAEKLKAKGFTRVTVLDEGLGYWRSKSYGTVSSPP
jgi:cytochrome c oxidase cbb3-type subunit 3/ubiquinol-cytochrome c reductase cytochrome c subunit